MTTPIKVHLVDGTYELFRSFYGAPSTKTRDGLEVGATRAFARSMLSLVRNEGATHVGIAFDHVIESFRNGLYDGYKTGDGVDPVLWAQAPLVEEAAEALGFVVWRMIEFEADDALATAADRYSHDARVERILICSPDKDLAQCVRGTRVVMVDRRRKVVIDEQGVVERYGVAPMLIPDWLALVGDSSDGYPGIPRWGEKSASTVLAAHASADAIADDPAQWGVAVRGAAGLAKSLQEHRKDLALYRRLATLRTDVPLTETLDKLAWRGPDKEKLRAFADRIGDTRLFDVASEAT